MCHRAKWILVFLLPPSVVAAQDSTRPPPPVSWLLAADLYYSYDLNEPPRHDKPGFLYNYNLHNRPAINLALLKASYTRKRLKAQAGLMAGTYPEANLAAEPAHFRNVFEANAGLKLARNRDYWLEAGIFSSHIGFESAIASDNATLTRSMAADNTPYYETGIKFSYKTVSQKWFFSALLLNGWQRIRRAPGNSGRCWGTQISHTPNDRLLVNWSSFQGNDKPDSARQFRSFHNFYTLFTLSVSWKLTAGLDIGFQRKLRQKGLENWYAPVLVLQYLPGKNWSLSGRLEYYHDPNNIVVDPVTPSLPFKTLGGSFNADRVLKKVGLFRMEYRLLQSRFPVFEQDNRFTKTNHCFTVSLVLKLTSS